MRTPDRRVQGTDHVIERVGELFTEGGPRQFR